jgi:two-component system phosphate regulon sensor histidine kinase PhoR
VSPWPILLLLAIAAVLAALWQREARARLRAERKAHEQADRMEDLLSRSASQARWSHAAAEAADDLLLVVDEGMDLQYANAAAQRMFGDFHPGATLISFTRSLDLEQLAADAVSLASPEGLVRVLMLDGRPHSAQAVPAADGTLALSLRDVSEMQRLSRARQDFVANLSHELRTPLTSLRLLADTLQRAAGRDPAVAQELIGKISIEVDTLHQMVQEMLDLAAIESGQQVVRLVAVPLDQLVNRPVELLTEQAARRDIDLAISLPGDLTVLADPDQARRAVTNVLHNAIKFTPEHGRIEIDGRPDPQNELVRLTIADNGPGISPAEIDRIFERFYRSAAVRGTPGTGLGLAIARHILRAHGGRIWAENRPVPEHGAVFHMTFRPA